MKQWKKVVFVIDYSNCRVYRCQKDVIDLFNAVYVEFLVYMLLILPIKCLSNRHYLSNAQEIRQQKKAKEMTKERLEDAT